LPTGNNLDVVDGGALVSVRRPFDADLVARVKLHVADRPPNRSVSVREIRRSRQMIVRLPVIDFLPGDKQLKFRYAILFVKVLNAKIGNRRFTAVGETNRAAGGPSR
jgi:hypothetical protein